MVNKLGLGGQLDSQTLMQLFHRSFVQTLFLSANGIMQNCTCDLVCAHCSCPLGSTMQLFRDFCRPKQVWRQLMSLSPHLLNSEGLASRDWLKVNLTSKKVYHQGLEWRQIFGFGCWYFWKLTNQSVLVHDFVHPNDPLVYAKGPQSVFLQFYAKGPQIVSISYLHLLSSNS